MDNGYYSGYRRLENERKITVTGEGTVSAKPDKATATLGIRTENQNLQQAQSENAKAANEMLDSLTSLGIQKEDIKTADFRIDPIYTYEDGKQLFQGYRVTHLFSITIRDAGQTGLIIDTAVENGANEVMNIQFSVANPEVYYSHALSLAVIDSFKKAQTIVRTIGLSTQPVPISITEETQKTVPGPFMVASLGSAESSGTPIEPGTLDIKAIVRAIYFW